MRALFDLSQPGEDGVPLRVHLEASYRATGREHPKLDTPPVPACFDRQMRLWMDLHRGRTVGLGLAPFSWGEIADYCRATGEQFSPADIHYVRMIEDEFHESRAAAEERNDKRRKAKAGT